MTYKTYKELSNEEKIVQLEDRIRRYEEPRSRTFFESAKIVREGREYADSPDPLKRINSYKDPTDGLHSVIRMDLGDSFNSFMGMTLKRKRDPYQIGITDDMRRRAEKLWKRRELLYHTQRGHGEEKNIKIRARFPQVVQDAKAPFFEDCGKLILEIKGLMEKELKRLKEETNRDERRYE
jgi:hypothetical protein